MSTVWIPADAGHNYNTAEEFGNVRYVFTREVDISVFQSERAARHVVEFFKENPPAPEDYLLFAGPPLFMVTVSVYLHRALPRLRTLIYHMRERKYIARDIPHMEIAPL